MAETGMFYKYPKLILFVIVFILYGNTLKNGYAIDDDGVTTNNCITSKGFSSIPKIFTSFYSDHSTKNKYEYRPLVKVSFAIEHQFFGVKPSVSHFFNLLIYFLCLLVLLKWLQLIFNKYPKQFSFLIVLVFAIMPIHTETVSNIKNRDILLSFLFVILGCVQLFKALMTNRNKLLLILFSLFCFYLSFLSKLDAIPYLAIIPVIALLGFKGKMKWALGFIGIFFASFILFRLTRRIGLEGVHGFRTFLYFENPLFFEKEFSFRIMSMFNSLGFYVIQCILPLKQSHYYGLSTIPVTEFSFFYGSLGVIFSGGILYGLWWSYKKRELAIVYGLFIFSACVSMYLNLIVPAAGIVADRFCFSPSLGIAILSVAAYQLWVDKNLKFSKTVKVAALLTTLFYSILVIQRNSEWKDLITLNDADVKKYPESVFLNYKQGANIMKSMEARNNSQLKEENQKQVAEAKAHLEKALFVYPDYPEALNQLSYILIFMYNDFKTALPNVNKSLSLEYSTEILYYKGICYRELHQPDSCERILLRCIENEKDYQNAYDLLVYDYNAKKEFHKSEALLEKAIENGVKSDKINKMLEQVRLYTKP